VRTRVCDLFGIDVPIFAFSHCRDVVAAVSRAGGFGVLGAATITPDQLELELQWLDKELGGEFPYGVNVLMAASYEEGTADELQARIPQGHREYVDGLIERFEIPELPPDAPPPTGIFGSIEFRGVPEVGLRSLEIAFDYGVKAMVSALGPAPKEIVDRAH